LEQPLIYDNFLSEQEYELLSRFSFFDNSSYWENLEQIENAGIACLVEKLRPIASFSDVVGIEYWCGQIDKFTETVEDFVTGTRYALPPHVDKDEVQYLENFEVVSPLWGAIFYAFDGPVKGGLLEIPGQVITPVKNRLVIFDVKKLHAVTAVTEGTRNSITLNFWDHQIATAPLYPDPSV